MDIKLDSFSKLFTIILYNINLTFRIIKIKLVKYFKGKKLRVMFLSEYTSI